MTLANWRDLAVVLLAVQAFVLGLVPGVALYFALRGIAWVIRKLRVTMPTVQSTFRKAATISEQVSQRVAAPIIATSAALAQMRRLRSASIASLSPRREV